MSEPKDGRYQQAREASPAGAAMSHEEFMARLEEGDRRETATSAVGG
ncbi:hypothetical protein OOK29_36160 [Streptomyces phaeochromogenes]|nr:hypothetical protein [Streptomyces phaeochromogenes]MCX5603586.1 hypothetical protein [Streptomyces phaeochromogenes]